MVAMVGVTQAFQPVRRRGQSRETGEAQQGHSSHVDEKLKMMSVQHYTKHCQPTLLQGCTDTACTRLMMEALCSKLNYTALGQVARYRLLCTIG